MLVDSTAKSPDRHYSLETVSLNIRMSNTAEESDSIPCVGIHVTQYLENSRARPWRKTHGRDSLPY